MMVAFTKRLLSRWHDGVILPRIGGGVGTRGICYSIKGEQDGQTTEDLHTRVQLEAVQLVKSSGKPMSQVARELGISDSVLSKWCKL